MKGKKKVVLLFIGSLIIVGIISYMLLPMFIPINANSDVDYISEGPYKGDLLASEYNRVLIWDLAQNKVVWEYRGDNRGLFFIHDADLLPNGNIMISDTVNDRVIEVNMTTKQVVWELNFRNSTQLNWSSYADQWGWAQGSFAREYVTNQRPAHGFWTHINDIQYINQSSLPGVTSPTILISVRNFDMLIEVTHNESRMIVWHAGKPGDHSIMNHQHGPCYLNDSDTFLVADSDNFRCIQLNRAGQIIWKYEYPPGLSVLKWVRDIDPLPNGHYLIDDSNNNRLLELDLTTNTIVKIWTFGVNGVPYDADYVPEKNWILVSNSYMNSIVILDYNTGLILRWIGFPSELLPFIYSLIALIVIVGYYLIKDLKESTETSKLKTLKKFKNIEKIILLTSLIICLILFKYVMAALWFSIAHPIFEYLPAMQLVP
ncbi:MAG: aryl-sulfate sulfotransferase [Candidatus Helarchaeota archaeon]